MSTLWGIIKSVMKINCTCFFHSLSVPTKTLYYVFLILIFILFFLILETRSYVAQTGLKLSM